MKLLGIIYVMMLAIDLRIVDFLYVIFEKKGNPKSIDICICVM